MIKQALSRRSFIRGAPAAAAAAPMAAKSIAAEIGGDGSTSYSATKGLEVGTSSAWSDVPLPDPDYHQRRMNDLEKIIRGEDDEDHGPHRHDDMNLAAHYDSLASMSPVMRRMMFDRAAELRRRARKVWYAQKELDDLRKHFSVGKIAKRMLGA